MSVRRALDATLAVLFALPLTSLIGEPSAFLSLKVLTAVVLVLTAARPAMGLCLLAGLLPMSPAFHATLPIGAIGRETQALVLAFLAGGLGRLAFAPAGPASRLAPPAWVLGLVIAAGGALLTAHELTGLTPAQALTEIWKHLTQWYFGATPILMDFRRAFAWIAPLALAVLVERVLRRERDMTEPVLRMAIVGAAFAALYTVVRVGQMVLASSDVMGALVLTIREYRYNAFYGDLNATGSLQLLFLIPAAWLATTRRAGWAWAAATPLALALWLTGSRAAVIAAFVGAAVAWILARRAPRRVWATAAVVVVGVFALAAWSTRPGRATMSQAWTIRWTLAVASFQAAATDPLLGVGVDRLRPAVAPFITPEFGRFWPPAAQGENAHNNFLQVLAESGVFGLAAFVWMLTASVGGRARWRPEAGADLLRPGVVGGLAAFLISCLAGHPLLVEPVRLCFFLWLGIVAAGRPDDPATDPWPARLVAAAAVLVAVILIARSIGAP